MRQSSSDGPNASAAERSPAPSHAALGDAPLAGVRVIDFGQFVAGPAATQVLVDLGADVIKVESVHGESTRIIGLYGESILRLCNRGKRAVAIDLSTESGRAIAWRLIESADIVVQNLRPGVMEKFGLGPQAVRERFPHLVYGTASGFGGRGPSRLRAGFDIAAQAESGLMWMTGEGDGDPQRVGAPVVDAVTGQVLAQALLAAYIRRLRIGVGDTVDVSLLEVAVHVQGPNWTEYFLTGNPPKRSGNGQTNVAPAADIVHTSDGQMVLSAYSPTHWKTLCTILNRLDMHDDPRFATNTDRIANRAELIAELRKSFAQMTTDEALELVNSNGLIAGRIAHYDDVLANPDVAAAGLFVDAGVGERAGRTMRSPWHLESVPEQIDWEVACPELGEHTLEVLADLGYDEAEIARLADDHVVVVARPASARV